MLILNIDTYIFMDWFIKLKDIFANLQERKQQKKEPTSFFEHFVVVGLRPHSNVQPIEAAFAKKKAWQRDAEKAGIDFGHHKGFPSPTLEPEVTAHNSSYFLCKWRHWYE